MIDCKEFLSRVALLAASAWLMQPCLARESVAAAAPFNEAVVRQRADALLTQMTSQEKAGQLSQYFYLSMFPPMAAGVDKLLQQGAVGSLVFVSDAAEANRLQKIALENSRLKIPLLFGYDVLHGLHTIFPVPLGMAASWGPKAG